MCYDASHIIGKSVVSILIAEQNNKGKFDKSWVTIMSLNTILGVLLLRLMA
jgi:hypothetical protein